ncbi:MAG: copper resistance protein B [Sinobacteraceae bacterium]|nr:copper resistance protein B [Nevskiaceae bacterium]
MNTIPRNLCWVAVLSLAFMAVPAFAQDSMQDMNMSHIQPPTKEPAKPATKKKPHSTKSKQTQQPAEHSMSGMDMSSMPNKAMPPPQPQVPVGNHPRHEGSMSGMDMDKSPMRYMPMQPPPNVTGELQVLDIGSQIGIRPVVRGLNGGAMQMDMQGMQMQGGEAPPDARSADYSDGVGYGSMPGLHMLDDAALAMLLVDRLEYFDERGGNGVALDAQGWYGTDANKLWVKAEGETGAGRLQDLRTEALWAHPIGIYWNTQLGVRHDFGVGPGRTWAAFGVQGLAPYFFDVEATFYVGQAGRTAFRFESEYELLLTQRLILQPRFEMDLYGRDDPQRGIGSGLSDATLGLRLRYEFTRKFAPYVGVEFERKFGRTADFARNAGEPAFDPRLVAGLHFWF